ncbi:hypothetical protein ACSU64_06880 [Bacillaceae bacterium C204]
MVVPICFRSVIIGYICSNEFVKESTIDEKLLSSFTLYGKEIGKFLEKSNSVEDPQGLSKRELEVMRRIAWGKEQEKWQIRWDQRINGETICKNSYKKTGRSESFPCDWRTFPKRNYFVVIWKRFIFLSTFP